MKKQYFEESELWLNRFITDSRIQIDEKLKSRTMNAHLLSLKQHNLKTIENYMKDTKNYIQELERKIEKLERHEATLTPSTVLNAPTFWKQPELEKERIRAVSISILQENRPELF